MWEAPKRNGVDPNAVFEEKQRKYTPSHIGESVLDMRGHFSFHAEGVNLFLKRNNSELVPILD